MTEFPYTPTHEDLGEPYSVFAIKPQNPAYSFTLLPEQTAYFHNLLVEESENLLSLMYDEHNPMQFVQKQAYLKARIDLLTEILNEGN